MARALAGGRIIVLARLAGFAAAVLMAAALVTAAPAAENDYVDARVCATCHTRIAADYRQTGMGRSMFRPTPANTVEDYTKDNEFYHALSDTHYSMIRRDGAYYQRRWQIGFEGKVENLEESKIDYIAGSGNHSRSYLHRTARGTFIELPLSWYSEKGGTWAMSPAFDGLHPLTRRIASYECVFCHTAYPRIPPGYDAPDSEPIFAGSLPEGIDCQRCHGPGGRHVRTVQTAGAKLEEIRASIVNPARLGPKLQMDVCMQCHLEPTSTAIPSLLRRFDRKPFSFRPGEPLEDFELAFDHAPGKGYDEKFEIVNSSAYRLRRSRCFLESSGALTCETCHDPHRVPRGEEAVRHYTSVCRECHTSALDSMVAAGTHPAGTDCVACHMPKRRTEDVVHVVMTDHLIARRAPPGNLLADLAERHPSESEEYHGEVVPYYPAKLPNALYGFVAQILLKNNLAEGLAGLDRELKAQQPRAADWYLASGDGWRASRKPAEAAAAYEQAILLRPGSLRALLSLEEALKEEGQLSNGAELLARALRLNPSDARAWYQSGTLAVALGHADDAIAKLQKAAALDPDLPGEYTSLAAVLMGVRRNDQAEAAVRQALLIDPYDASAWDLSGRLLAGEARLPEALFDFARANRYRPNFAPHLYDYALALASAGKSLEAQASVEDALRADPKLAEAHELFGRLLAGQRRLQEAASEYREALRLRPNLARAQLDLASALADLGDMTGAVEHLRQAAKGSDPQVARLASQALARLGRQ
jgi:tetratricopeptide (TPR) repeat protein